ncbi:MAG: DUF2441 domain-containing protein [Clostridia bacterium]|nr:DUF2441 domain-containing protein [Clostridia bacterium]
MFEIVKDKILYQATNWDYKIGDIIEFGKTRNGQAKRVFEQTFLMPNGQSADVFLKEKINNNQLLSMEDMKAVQNIVNGYEFCLREIGMEIERRKKYPDCPSRLKGMFLTDKLEIAKEYIGAQKGRDCKSTAKVVVVKLNGRLLKSNNSFNARDGKSIDQFAEQSNKYWQGVDKGYEHKFNEFLFEGTAEVVDIIK